MLTFFVIHCSYVGNLDRRCTEQFIKDVFSKCGKVVRCKMINAVGIICCTCVQSCLTCKKCRPAYSRSFTMKAYFICKFNAFSFVEGCLYLSTLSYDLSF